MLMACDGTAARLEGWQDLIGPKRGLSGTMHGQSDPGRLNAWSYAIFLAVASHQRTPAIIGNYSFSDRRYSERRGNRPRGLSGAGERSLAQRYVDNHFKSRYADAAID